jgi:redox-sensitive bicupin YhaK (pirin superfamily)
MMRSDVIDGLPRMSAILEIISGRPRDLGGFSVRRVLPIAHRKTIGPFIFFDHLGPNTLAAGSGMDVRPHPHIGLATVTYLFEGRMRHRDSLGTVMDIEPGAVNWMTAGRGIVHSERTAPEDRVSGITMHGIQSWVALPQADEEMEPAFAHHPAASLPSITFDGAKRTLIAGTAFHAQSPVAVRWPMFYIAVEAEPEAKVFLPEEHEERAVYVAEGAIELDGQRIEAGSMAVLAPGLSVHWRALEAARVMMLGGAPIDGERHIWWNLVSSRPERIAQAKLDWREQRFGAVPGETEFIPLPES